MMRSTRYPDEPKIPSLNPTSIFKFDKRKLEKTNTFNTVFLVPTGIGAEIGGHAGDANPVAKLFASVSDTLITHPNVVNASDINELPENGLYVEGSIISRLLMGTIGLQKVRTNKVLLIADKHTDEVIDKDLVNAISAARCTIGLNCPKVIQLDPATNIYAERTKSGRAVGRIEGLKKLFDVITENINNIDALALSSTIKIEENVAKDYFDSNGEMVNPWGGVEAMLTHAISVCFNIPTAHAPAISDSSRYMEHFGIVDPRMSAEVVSSCYIHCILKGLHRSPKIIIDRELFNEPEIINSSDISCLVIPENCIGLPTLAALEQGIPVIAVRENRNCMKNDLTKLPFKTDKLFIVDNYVEAAGLISVFKSGVSLSSVRRPIVKTNIIIN
ncbi:MAG: DUF3326 domain-containing protein [bacterium]|nr:DUF3326 domain-containing protein [bacterium]